MMIRLLVVRVLLSMGLSACTSYMGSKEFLETEWEAIEKRHPKFARAYKIQQASLVGYAVAASSSRFERATPSLCDLLRYQQVYLALQGFQSTTCENNRIVVDPGMVPKIGECWKKFERCEAADVPADCESQRDRCMGGGQ